MKELTIEQKAKAYDEAVENMRKFRDALNNHEELDLWVLKKEIVKDIEYYFPELKENEDERVRKTLKEYFINSFQNNGVAAICGMHIKDILAWLEKQGKNNMSISEATKQELEDNLNKALEKETPESCNEFLEKQGEQKPADKVEPKDYNSIDPHFGKPAGKVEPNFKIEKDKWYVCTQTFVLRGKEVIIKGQTYQAEKDNVIKGEDGCLFVDRHDGKASDYLRSWTFQDAKDGDILIYNDSIFIFDEIYENDLIYYGIYEHNKFHNDKYYSFLDLNTININIIYPATKEQRDTLEKAMADAGYTFNFEKKELKKLGQSEVTKMSDQEEIAEIPFGAKDSELQEATYFIPQGFHAEIDNDKVVIKKGEKPTAWSEEDEEIVEALNEYVKNLDIFFSEIKISDKDTLSKEFRERVQHWLKSLKERYAWKKSLATADLENSLCDIQDGYSDTSYEYRILGEAIEFIRCTEPQPHWKPSKEQITELHRVISGCSYDIEPLVEIEKHLKKLMEE